MESPKAVTDAKVEAVNAKGVLRLLEGRASANSSAMDSSIENRNCVRDDLATASAKLQVAKGAFNDNFDHYNRHCSIVCLAEAPVQERLKSSLWNYIQTIFAQVKQSNEAYQLDVDCNMSSLGTEFSNDIRSMYA